MNQEEFAEQYLLKPLPPIVTGDSVKVRKYTNQGGKITASWDIARVIRPPSETGTISVELPDGRYKVLSKQQWERG